MQAGEEKAEENKERLRVVEIRIADCQKGMMEFGSRIDACSACSMDSEQQFHEIFSQLEEKSDQVKDLRAQLPNH